VAPGVMTRVRLVSAGDRPQLSWAEGLRFTLPPALLARPALAGRLSASGDLTLPRSPIGWSETDAANVREQAAFTDTAPASSRLPFAYHRVPGGVRAVVAAMLGRWRRTRESEWAAFPGWPLDLTSDFIADAADGAGVRRIGPAPVVLSHDIDSAEGLENLVQHFLPAEEAAGARSTSYIVPCAWPLDHQLLGEVVARGHEAGVHGYDHANRTPFANAEERARRLDAARALVERYAAIGYRAPSLLRTRALLRDLASRFRYDSSIPTSGGPFPVPNNGCASARMFRVEGIAEIPLTLPRDGSLRFLGHSPSEIARLWIACAETIARSGGVVTLLTHCERRFSGNAAMLAAYQTLLNHLSGSPDRFRFITAATLWRERFEGADGA
jgi:peptidoglycan/xylan/chitin deacetylase (PgdA/CDA1 family)